MGLIVNQVSASQGVAHNASANTNMIAVTGAMAIARHAGANSHLMPDEATFFYVAGTPGDSLTKSTFGGDMRIVGSAVIEDGLTINAAEVLIGADPVVIPGESSGGSLIFAGLALKNKTENDLDFILNLNQPTASITVDGNAITFNATSMGITNNALIQLITDSVAASALIEPLLVDGGESLNNFSGPPTQTFKIFANGDFTSFRYLKFTNLTENNITVSFIQTSDPSYVSISTNAFTVFVNGSTISDTDLVTLINASAANVFVSVEKYNATFDSISAFSPTFTVYANTSAPSTTTYSYTLVRGDLDVAGAVSIEGNLVVTGSVTYLGTTVLATVEFGEDIEVGNLTVNDNLTVEGNLVVQGTTTSLNVTNLNVEDVIILLNASGSEQNANGGIALEKGSNVSGQDLVFGRVADDTWGVGRKDTSAGTVTTLADMTLVNMRSNRFELGGDSNWIDANGANSHVMINAAQGIHLQADLDDIEIEAAGDIVLNSTAGLLYLEKTGVEVARFDFASSDLVLDAVADIVLDADGGQIFLKDNGNEFLKFDMQANNILPAVTETVALGSSSFKFSNVHSKVVTAGDVMLSNGRGDWTLIEEEGFISFRDNRTGRRFKMLMEDITDSGTYGPDIYGNM